MRTLQKFFSPIVIALSLVATKEAMPVSLSIAEAQDFNLITWQDANLINSDTEGRVAVGGNTYFRGYSIGTHADLDNAAAGAFIVGGDLSAGDGQVYNGSLYVGGSYTGPSYNLNSAVGSILQANLGKHGVPFDFDAAQASLTAKSSEWGAQASTGTSVLEYSTLTLQGFDSALNIFNIDAASLSSASTLNLFVPSSAKALINVMGAAVDFSNKGLGGAFDASRTLFNFHEATSLTMQGIGVIGSILAPHADVTFYSGQMNGQLVANSFTGAEWGSGELHNYVYENDPEPTGVPDVGSTLGMGLLGLTVIIVLKRLK